MGQQIYAFEGVDGVGKSTLVESVHKELEKDGYSVETIKFPIKDTPIGNLCYGITETSLTDNSNPYTRAMTFLLNQDEGIARIRNALDEGKIILLDRWSLSTMAYEGAHLLHDSEDVSDSFTQEELIESVLDMMQWILDAKYDRLFHPIPFTFYCDAYGSVADVLEDASVESKYDQDIGFQRAVHQAYNLALEVMDVNDLGFDQGYGRRVSMVDGVYFDENGDLQFTEKNHQITRRNLDSVVDNVMGTIDSLVE